MPAKGRKVLLRTSRITTFAEKIFTKLSFISREIYLLVDSEVMRQKWLSAF